MCAFKNRGCHLKKCRCRHVQKSNDVMITSKDFFQKDFRFFDMNVVPTLCSHSILNRLSAVSYGIRSVISSSSSFCCPGVNKYLLSYIENATPTITLGILTKLRK